MKKSNDKGSTINDFDTLADELSKTGYNALDMNKVRRDSIQKQREYQTYRKRRSPDINESLDCDDDGNEIHVVSGERKNVDPRFRRPALAQRYKRKPRQSQIILPVENRPILPYPSCLPKVEDQRMLTVPFGLLHYPTLMHRKTCPAG